ncbi:MAG: hypothetical protein KGJ93_01440, partial [Patescibacteria group bacterium]|nr:hypothetical protein [Patescibacteria group bacterium]
MFNGETGRSGFEPDAEPENLKERGAGFTRRGFLKMAGGALGALAAEEALEKYWQHQTAEQPAESTSEETPEAELGEPVKVERSPVEYPAGKLQGRTLNDLYADYLDLKHNSRVGSV